MSIIFFSSKYNTLIFFIGIVFLITSLFNLIDQHETTIENLSSPLLHLRKSGKLRLNENGRRSLFNNDPISGIQYHGGRILSSKSLHIYHLYVGDFTTRNKESVKARSIIDYLGAYIANSVWFQGIQSYYEVIDNSKYNISSDVFFMERRSLIITSSPSTTSQSSIFSDADIERAIKSQMKMANGALSVDSSSVYMVLFRGNYTVSDQNGKKWRQDWCGYHGSFTFNGTVIKYGVLGDPTSNSVVQSAQRCISTLPGEESSSKISSITALNMGSIYADTLAGILTNPTARGWYQNGSTSEVVEICNPNFDRFVDESIGHAQYLFRLPQVYRLGYGCWPNVPLTSFYPSVAATILPSRKPSILPSIRPSSIVPSAVPPTVKPSASPTIEPVSSGLTMYLYPCINDTTCGNHSQITIPPQYSSIPRFTFANFAPIRYVSIPTTVTSIGDAAFSNCFNLVTVIIPTSITSLPVSVFMNATKLLNVNIPTSVTAVGDLAFGGCSSLVTMILPTSLMVISYQMFLLASNLDVVVIPTSITFIDAGAFSRCKVTEIILPTSVVEISGSTFSLSGLTRIYIPTTITRIAYSAFYNCSMLSAANLPTSLLSIERQSFYESALQSVVIPTSVTNLGLSSFSSCRSLALVTIPTSITTLPYLTFGSSSIQFVVIPTSVTFLGNAVFSDCGNLFSVIIPTSITVIPFQCFYSSGLFEVTIPTSVTAIEDEAFYNNMFDGAFISTSVLYIGARAFFFNSIGFLNIPTSVISVGEESFAYSYPITLTLPSSLKEISSKMFQNSQANNNPYFIEEENSLVVTIPSSVTRIGSYSFQGFAGLATIIIPHSVVVIEEYAFADCPHLYCVVWNSSGVTFDSNLVFENSLLVGFYNTISECGAHTDSPTTESPTSESPTTISPTTTSPTTPSPRTASPTTTSPATTSPTTISTTTPSPTTVLPTTISTFPSLPPSKAPSV